MAEIINLRKARKAKGRAEAEARAIENRIKFGRTKEEKRGVETAKRLDERRLEGHRRDDGGE
jgi:hypothetical protein